MDQAPDLVAPILLAGDDQGACAKSIAVLPPASLIDSLQIPLARRNILERCGIVAGVFLLHCVVLFVAAQAASMRDAPATVPELVVTVELVEVEPDPEPASEAVAEPVSLPVQEVESEPQDARVVEPVEVPVPPPPILDRVIMEAPAPRPPVPKPPVPIEPQKLSAARAPETDKRVRALSASATERAASDAAARQSYGALLSAEISRRKAYPPGARARGKTGAVGVSFVVGASGRVVSHSILSSSGDAELDAAAHSLILAIQAPPPPGGSFRTSTVIRYALR